MCIYIYIYIHTYICIYMLPSTCISRSYDNKHKQTSRSLCWHLPPRRRGGCRASLARDYYIMLYHIRVC